MKKDTYEKNTNCKYLTPNCLYRGTDECKKCIDSSKFEWDYTNRY